MKIRNKPVNYEKHVDEDFFYTKLAKGKSGIISYYDIKGKMKVEYVWNTNKILILCYNMILYVRYLIRKMKGEI